MKATDFPTAQEARDHEEVSYVLITSNEAEQFFRLTGQIGDLETAKANATAVTIVPNLPTTIGEIAAAILSTMAKADGQFGIDPKKTSGQLNRTAAAELVKANVISQPVIDAFFEIGTKRVKPFENLTDQEYTDMKAREALTGETVATAIFYNTVDSAVNGHFVNAGQYRTIRVAALFDTLPSHDCKVTVIVESEPVSGETWVEEKPLIINVKANAAPKWEDLPRTIKARRFRVKSATVDIATAPFKLDVQGV